MNQLSIKNKHDFCPWTLNPGSAGFLKKDARPSLKGLKTPEQIAWFAEKVLSLLPDSARGKVGIELHLRNEVNKENVNAVIDALKSSGMKLGMITPGFHHYCADGGPMSMNSEERALTAEIARETIDLAYQMRDVWFDDCAPTVVYWNGGHQRQYQGPEIVKQWQFLVESRAAAYAYERDKGNVLFHGGESKPNEGAPVLVPQTESAELILADQAMRLAGISQDQAHRYGLNPEKGHLDLVPSLDAATTLAPFIKRVVHYHPNSQGTGPTGSTLGGSGMFDVDHEALVTASDVTISYMLREAGFSRIFGHDFQPRPGDSIDDLRRAAARSVIAVEACWAASDPSWGNWQAEREKLISENKHREARDILDEVVSQTQALFLDTCIDAGLAAKRRFTSSPIWPK